MDEQYISEQYKLVAEEKTSRLPNGTFFHDSNIELLVYQALTYNNPELASGNRPLTIKTLGEITQNFQKYLEKIRLGGLTTTLKHGKIRSHLDILKYYDRQFRLRFGQASIFDLTVEPHMHEWGDTVNNLGIKRKAPNGYFKKVNRKMKRAEKIVYHCLTENYPNLEIESRPRTEVDREVQRKVVIESIEAIPENLIDALTLAGLGGFIQSMDGINSSPLKVFEIYDMKYQKLTGDTSLFDLNDKYHIHKWGGKFRAPSKFWNDFNNIERAIYHTITETNPKLLKTDKREEAIAIIRSLPIDLFSYFKKEMDIGGMMCCAFKKPEEKESPRKVIEIFGEVYGRKHGFASLVDNSQTDYIQFNRRNIMIRHPTQ